MPTPTRSFLDIAARYGGVDPDDPEAVHHWFSEVLPSLPRDTIEEILKSLLEAEGSSDDKETVRSYPRGVPLPSLSASPPATIPLFAAGWRGLLTRLTRKTEES